MAAAQYIDFDDLGAVSDSVWSQINAGAAGVIRPIARPLDDALRAAGAPADLRSKIVSRPLDAILDIFDPIEDAVGRAVDRVMARKGTTQTFFGQRRNIARVQTSDLQGDTSTRNLLKSLRTAEAFMVLFWTQPLELAEEMAKEGLSIAKDAAVAVKAAATDVARAAEATWQSVTSLFSGLGQTVAGEAAVATAAAAGGGVTLETIIIGAIGTIVTAITGAVTTVVVDKITSAAGQPTGLAIPTFDQRLALQNRNLPGASGQANIGPAVPLNTSGPGIPAWAIALGAVAVVGVVVAMRR